MESLLIGDLPPNLLFSLLNKLLNVPLCRMRQTSKSMDSFVEENRERLSSRAIDGLHLEFTLTNKKGNTKVMMQVDTDKRDQLQRLLDPKEEGPIYDLDKFDLPKQLSAICVEKMDISKPFTPSKQKDPLPINEAKVLETLSHFPKADNISLGAETSLMVKMVDLMSVRSFFNLEWVPMNEDKERYKLIETLRKSEKRNFLRMRYYCSSGEYKEEGLFDLVKVFDEYDFRGRKFEAKEFLKNIFLSQDPGTIQRLAFSLRRKHSSVPLSPLTIPGVSFTKLWDIHDLPEETAKSLKRRWKYNLLLSIRHARFHDKFAVITEFQNHDLYSLDYCIHFVESSSKIWPCVFEESDVELKDEFTDPEDVDQIEKFKELVKETRMDDVSEESESSMDEEDDDEEEDEEGSDEESEEDSDEDDDEDFFGDSDEGREIAAYYEYRAEYLL